MKVNTDYILIDLFDVLTKSYVLEYKDIFNFLEFDFKTIFPERLIINFAKMREYVEINNPNFKIKQIYKYISDNYNINYEKLQNIEKKEKELIKRFYQPRTAIKEIITSKGIIIYSKKVYEEKYISELLSEINIKYDEIYLLKEFSNIQEMFENIKVKYDNNITIISADYPQDIENAIKLGIKNIFFPKVTDIFLGYINEYNVNKIGLINKKISNSYVDLNKYTEIEGVRLSIATIACNLFDKTNINMQYDFDASPELVGYYCLGMHLLSLCSWLKSKSNNKKIVFMGRDGYIPKQAYDIYTGGKCIDDYLEISRKSYLPLLINMKEDLYFINNFANIANLNEKTLVDSLMPILKISKKDYKELSEEKFRDYNSYIKSIQKIEKYYSIDKSNKYKESVKKYFDRIIDEESWIFDIGYSGFPELFLNNFISKKVNTLFIHTNDSTAFTNSKFHNGFILETFYNNKPKYTGTLREILISDVNPSCIAYKKIFSKIFPVLDKQYYNNEQIDLIKKIQHSSLLFIKDFISIFKDYVDIIDFNSYYMSLPIEYFLHNLTKDEKLKIFGDNFKFEVNNNEFINLVEEWEENIRNE